MRIKLITVFASCLFMSWLNLAPALVIDHDCTDLSLIPSAWISQAKADLHIAYQHTSHGSQLISGMDTLEGYGPFGATYEWSDNGSSGLDLDDYGIPGCADLSQGDYIDGGVTPWVTATRTLLNNASNYHVNVIMWSWCSINGHNAQRYLDNMEILISEYGPGGSSPRAADHPVLFVFMTGHAEGQGEYEEYNSDTGEGNVHYNNQLIRQHCVAHNRVLFDFADIEAYNPSGEYFWDLDMYDNLDYYEAGPGERNWAEDWLAAHPGSELALLTAQCGSCAHSDSPPQATLNCVLKARAAWWLFARLAGWSGSAQSSPTPTAPIPTPTPCGATVELTGYVTDLATGEPIPGAQVALTTENYGIFTDNAGAGGDYSILASADECSTWDYAIKVMAPGYRSYRGTVTLEISSANNMDFELSRAPAAGGGDFNGDGTVDAAFFRPDTKLWKIREMTQFYFGRSDDIPVPADYDGDGSDDYAYYRPAQGLWWIQGQTRIYFGRSADIPAPADYNGDGTDECAFYRPSEGLWKIAGGSRVYCGKSGAVPIPGDYNGDGSADVAYFLSGLWVVRSQTRFWRGRSGDIPLPGDYLGEGSYLPSVYRPSSGLWIVGGSRVYFGRPWDSPCPADYDGDTTTDLGIYRSGHWSIQGLSSFYFGQEGDHPLSR